MENSYLNHLHGYKPPRKKYSTPKNRICDEKCPKCDNYLRVLKLSGDKWCEHCRIQYGDKKKIDID